MSNSLQLLRPQEFIGLYCGAGIMSSLVEILFVRIPWSGRKARETGQTLTRPITNTLTLDALVAIAMCGGRGQWLVDGLFQSRGIELPTIAVGSDSVALLYFRSQYAKSGYCL